MVGYLVTGKALSNAVRLFCPDFFDFISGNICSRPSKTGAIPLLSNIPSGWTSCLTTSSGSLEWIPLLQEIQSRGKSVIAYASAQEALEVVQYLEPSKTMLFIAYRMRKSYRTLFTVLRRDVNEEAKQGG
ncbi:MAG: hypothetical protein QXT77_08295, partial [Candidatus Methanomethylicaceae archaeon]